MAASSSSSPREPIKPAPVRGSVERITDFLHTEIPLTRTIGIAVRGWDGQTVTLAAPLAPNQNHTDTAFGGAISSIAILAGYSLLYLLLEERGISSRILVQKSSIDYLRPIDDEMRATATIPAAGVEEFLEVLPRRRRARLTVESQVFSRQTLAATHSGLYVAMLY